MAKVDLLISKKIKTIKLCFLIILFSTCLYNVFILFRMSNEHQPLSDHLHHSPKVAVGVLVTPNTDMYWDRFVTMSSGWYTSFSILNGYTFDRVDSKNDSRLVQVDKLFSSEKTGSGNEWTNIPLAAFQHMATNIVADWYLQVDEDTIIVPINLMRLINTLNTSPRPLMIGKCASFQDAIEGSIEFNVGGSGILMNRALVSALTPHFTECRKRFNTLYFSDARVGACVTLMLNRSDAVCPCSGPHYGCAAGGRLWSFTNRNARLESQQQPPDALIVSMHEKSPSRIKMLNRYVKQITERGVDVTWREIIAAMDEDGY